MKGACCVLPGSRIASLYPRRHATRGALDPTPEALFLSRSSLSPFLVRCANELGTEANVRCGKISPAIADDGE